MNGPLVSIIIPSFNNGNLLRGALESISAQTFKRYEVIIIDGGSDDDTAQIAKHYSYLPIRFYSEPDEGIYDAMNKGIAISNGVFIYFLGCDDRLFSSETLRLVFDSPAIIDKHVIYGDVLKTSQNEKFGGSYSSFKLAQRNICHQGIFIQRKVFDKLGFFETRYQVFADWEFNMRWFHSPWIKKQYIPETIAVFADNGFSSVTTDAVFRGEYDSLIKRYFPKIIYYARKISKLIFPKKLMFSLRRLLKLD